MSGADHWSLGEAIKRVTTVVMVTDGAKEILKSMLHMCIVPPTLGVKMGTLLKVLHFQTMASAIGVL